MSEKTAIAAQPIMRSALGSAWEQLGDVVRRHYAVTPGINQSVVMTGHMNVFHSRLAYPFLLAGRLMGALIAKRGTHVPVSVRNWCTAESAAMHWHRTFMFAGEDPLIFSSRMEYVTGDEIIEYVRFGIGVRMRLSERNGALVFKSCGYQWDLGRVRLRLPDWIFLGKAEICEIPIDDHRFRVEFVMRHPLLGKTFGYAGEFTLEPSASP